MVNPFKPSEIPTYYWNNLKVGTYAFQFFNIKNIELITVKNKDDYIKCEVKYICSNIDFYGIKKLQKMYLVLPYKGFTIAINLFKDRNILNRITDTDIINALFIKKSKKILRFMDITISKPKDKEEFIHYEEEIVE